MFLNEEIDLIIIQSHIIWSHYQRTVISQELIWTESKTLYHFVVIVIIYCIMVPRIKKYYMSCTFKEENY